MGLDAGDKLTAQMMSALDVVDDARAWRENEEIEKTKRDAEAHRQLHGGPR